MGYFAVLMMWVMEGVNSLCAECAIDFGGCQPACRYQVVGDPCPLTKVEVVQCPTCEGKGWVSCINGRLKPSPPPSCAPIAFSRARVSKCPACHGSGIVHRGMEV